MIPDRRGYKPALCQNRAGWRCTNSNLTFAPDGTQSVFIGGQNGKPKGLMYPNRADLAPRFGISQSTPRAGLVTYAAHGILYTPVDLNCHNDSIPGNALRGTSGRSRDTRQ